MNPVDVQTYIKEDGSVLLGRLGAGVDVGEGSGAKILLHLSAARLQNTI
jgi:hypothetical protein